MTPDLRIVLHTPEEADKCVRYILENWDDVIARRAGSTLLIGEDLDADSIDAITEDLQQFRIDNGLS